mgnify:CR=1 FL=1
MPIDPRIGKFKAFLVHVENFETKVETRWRKELPVVVCTNATYFEKSSVKKAIAPGDHLLCLSDEAKKIAAVQGCPACLNHTYVEILV